MSTTDPTTNEPSSRDRRRGVPRWAKWTVIGIVGAVILFFGGILLYAKVLNDSPDEFDEGDLDAALSAEATDAAATGDGAGLPADGAQWVATDQSQVGYRVEEILFGIDTTAVGRSNQVTGTLTIDGTTVTSTEFSVEVATITSDESRRDNQFKGRIMSADQFPTATFALTQPIELGTEPADGAAVTTTATGELTLRGVTNTVTFEVTAKQENGLIGVQGSIPVVFADYDIANPSNGGVSTEDNGLVEFVLVFEPGT